MSRTPLRLDYAVQTVSPLRLPATAGSRPTLAGSTVKGAARRSAATVAAILRLPLCREDGDPRCPLCRLFGAPGAAAAVNWSTALPAEESLHGGQVAAWEVRGRRPVDRATGRSTDAAPLARPALPADLLFRGHVHGWLAGDGKADAALLAVALLRLEYLAGGNAAGFGRVSVTINALLLAGVARDVDDVLGTLPTQEEIA